MPYSPRKQHAAGQRLARVAEYRAHHRDDACRRGVERRAGLEQPHDLGAAEDRALNERRDLLGGKQLGDRDPLDRGEPRHRNHRVAVGAHRQRRRRRDGCAGLLGDGEGEAGGVEDAAHAEHALGRQPGLSPGEVGHDVERVGDADEHRVGRGSGRLWSMTLRMIELFAASRSSRVMPGLRGSPAVITTRSLPAVSA